LTDQLAGHGEAIEGRRGGIQPTELGGDIIAAIRAKFPQHQYEKTTRLLLLRRTLPMEQMIRTQEVNAVCSLFNFLYIQH
jgi:hypothetical protein